ncbi:MAG: Phosphatidylserine decarboxylase proenzyme [Steroidobacteraceae bacterium]|nr:Phosphatidylserine decarboxylase proenzyme [Steroidobacteraceae bacterium]
MSGTDGVGARLFVALQYLLPQHGLSRLVHALARARTHWVKNGLIRAFLRGFSPDLSDALETDPYAYPSFNAFFTRALRADTRPVAADAAAVASPVDGTVSECGPIRGDRLLQAKGHDYTLGTLLAGRESLAARFEGGRFATIYLAPWNYHRIHMPLAGTLAETWYVPGRLFSVNQVTAAHVAGLFARNERVICAFDGPAPFALVLVGALNVGSMETVWHGEITPRRPRELSRLDSELPALAPPRTLEKGAEMGRFNMGSTVILLLPPGHAEWDTGLSAGRSVRVGERIGSLTPPLPSAR